MFVWCVVCTCGVLGGVCKCLCGVWYVRVVCWGGVCKCLCGVWYVRVVWCV